MSIITGIQKEEKEAVEKRSQQVLMALKNLDIKANKVRRGRKKGLGVPESPPALSPPVPGTLACHSQRKWT